MRFAKCHPDRKHHAKDQCKQCYITGHQMRLYRKRRAAGWPYWQAWCRTPEGAARRLLAIQKYRKAHQEKYRAYARKYYHRNRLLYGGDPRKNLMARVKWLEAKEADRLKRLSPAQRGL